MTPAIRLASALFFASGAAALVFETLWFRRAGLAFGNSVWAGALVLSSFMAGMALGNALAAQWASRLRAPLRVVAGLELGIAVIGVSLVAALPLLGPALAPLFRPLLATPWLVQPLRFLSAFVVLLAPAIAMGATLPLLVHALRGRDPDFGHLLGRLYGWNTLGAMVGAVSAELIWIPLGGIYTAAAAAAGLNTVAAAGALWLQRIEERATPPPPDTAPRRLSATAIRILLAAAGAGALALAFEVIWFRVVIQYLPNSSAMFAWMLAVVLGGIALGSLLASAGFRLQPTLDRFAPAVAAAAGALAIASHASIPGLIEPLLERMEALDEPPGALFLQLESALLLSITLMLPVSVASGMLFAMLGKRLEAELGIAGRATGLLALSNSGGAAVGPLVAGFLLLPELGIDGSTVLLSAGYLVVAALAWDAASARAAAIAAAAITGVALAVFPYGLHERTLIRMIQAQYGANEEVIAIREGVVETAVVTRVRWRGEPRYHRLITDGYTMAAQTLAANRYMRLFAYLPAAFHPRLESALLISFGVGNTAIALAELDELERIDIVDISPEILSLAGLIHSEPGSNPLDDPRVRVHIEDGRYFLQTATERYDLITAEPPPPAFAGVVNLYTREYFELMRGRLKPGGLASYWLPASQLRPVDSQSIVAAFCGAFPDCSLWEADPADWILLGSRGATTPVSEERILSLWKHERLGPSLRAIGLEQPGQLGALFLADAAFLVDWAAAAAPLVDAHPERAPAVVASWTRLPDEFDWTRDEHARISRFVSGSKPGGLWPRSVLEQSVPHFEMANFLRNVLFDSDRPIERRLAELHAVLSTASLESPVRWILGSNDTIAAAAARLADRGDSSPEVHSELATAALARRDFDRAADQLGLAGRPDTPSRENLLRAYALAMAGRPDEARRVAQAAGLEQSAEFATAWLAIVALIEAGPDDRSAPRDRPSS
ncbi:MAG: fused MFS/spermidine synthase [Myxococcota bacterium]|nr:fused MFS/spermidine synthase [Myxococcota bacterium]